MNLLDTDLPYVARCEAAELSPHVVAENIAKYAQARARRPRRRASAERPTPVDNYRSLVGSLLVRNYGWPESTARRFLNANRGLVRVKHDDGVFASSLALSLDRKYSRGED